MPARSACRPRRSCSTTRSPIHFLAKFAARAAALPAGDPRGHVVLGACISADAVRRVADLIKDATGKGAVVLPAARPTAR